jgi:uncharacterized membrane protein
MIHKSHRSVTIVLAILLLALMVAACGATPTPTAAPIPPTATKGPAAPTATTAPSAPAAPTATKAPAAPAPATATTAPAAPTAPAAATGVSFSKDILPILQKNCTRCHSGNAPRSGLRLDTFAATMTGGNNPPSVVASNPEKSPLYTLVKSGAMPFGGTRLSDSDIQMIYDWIKAGALDN